MLQEKCVLPCLPCVGSPSGHPHSSQRGVCTNCHRCLFLFRLRWQDSISCQHLGRGLNILEQKWMLLHYFWVFSLQIQLLWSSVQLQWCHFSFSAFHKPLTYFQLPSTSSRISISSCPPPSYPEYLICPKSFFISSKKPEYWLYHKLYHVIFKLSPYMISNCLMHKIKHNTNKVTKEVFCVCSDFLNFNVLSWFPLKMSPKN